MTITVETAIAAPVERVWRAWTTPADIMQWNSASDDRHTTAAEVDLREGGAFSSRMRAKDGSAGFAGIYTKVVPHRLIECRLGERVLAVEFVPAEGTTVRETFDADDTHPAEHQRSGWQAILDRFRRHAEAGRQGRGQRLSDRRRIAPRRRRPSRTQGKCLWRDLCPCSLQPRSPSPPMWASRPKGRSSRTA